MDKIVLHSWGSAQSWLSISQRSVLPRSDLSFRSVLSSSPKSLLGPQSYSIMSFRPKSFWKNKPGRFTLPSMGRGSACTARKRLGSWCWRGSQRACAGSSGCYSQVREGLRAALQGTCGVSSEAPSGIKSFAKRACRQFFPRDGWSALSCQPAPR